MTDEALSCLRSAREGDREAAEKLVNDNSGLIWSVARRFFGRGVDSDDLYQLGCVGFLKAIAGYDESYGTQFSTYAVPKISGEIRRFLRDDGAVKVSRGIKERAALIRSARQSLEQKLGREPALSELAAEMDTRSSRCRSSTASDATAMTSTSMQQPRYAASARRRGNGRAPAAGPPSPSRHASRRSRRRTTQPVSQPAHSSTAATKKS